MNIKKEITETDWFIYILKKLLLLCDYRQAPFESSTDIYLISINCCLFWKVKNYKNGIDGSHPKSL